MAHPRAARGHRAETAARRTRHAAVTDQRLWTRGAVLARGDKDAREIEPEEDRDPLNTRSVRKDHIDPYLPDDVKDKDLDRIARNELKMLTPENQEFVAKHS